MLTNKHIMGKATLLMVARQKGQFVKNKDFYALVRQYCGEDAVKSLIRQCKTIAPGRGITLFPKGYNVETMPEGSERFASFVFMGTAEEVVYGVVVTAATLDDLGTADGIERLTTKLVRDADAEFRPELN
jgi:hypothetical protein